MTATFAERLTLAIARGGPIPVAQFMAQANAYYYATRDPLGVAGDFITAPEIHQMFGEMVGVWFADVWARAGRPPRVLYVEPGPGRGTLARDALRVMARFGLSPEVHFIETSPALRARQAALGYPLLTDGPERLGWLINMNQVGGGRGCVSLSSCITTP